MDVGIIGAGSISHCHMEAYRKLPNVTVAAVCDIQEDRARAFAETYGRGAAQLGGVVRVGLWFKLDHAQDQRLFILVR